MTDFIPIIVPTVAFDIATLFAASPNFEGIAAIGDSVVLLSDNHYKVVTGPSVGLLLRDIW